MEKPAPHRSEFIKWKLDSISGQCRLTTCGTGAAAAAAPAARELGSAQCRAAPLGGRQAALAGLQGGAGAGTAA